MLCGGDYSQNLGWRTQLGVKSKDSVWADLFHPTKQRNEDNRFENTSKILNDLLSKLPENIAEYKSFLEKVVSDYLTSSSTPKEWRYYFIKYTQMRYDTYGMYWWNDKNDKPYEAIIMHTEKALNGKNWNIFAYTLSQLYSDIFEVGNFAYQGDKLRIKGKNITIEILNGKFIISEEGKGSIEKVIEQDCNGNDLGDRIGLIYSELKSMNLFS